MNLYEYPSPTAAYHGLMYILHVIISEYTWHQKRLKDIEEGKSKTTTVTNILHSPSEKDIFDVSKYLSDSKEFQNKGSSRSDK